jgi:hypothetical protein
MSPELKDIYPICRCCWNVVTYKWSSQRENLNHLFCHKVSFLAALPGQFRLVGQCMKQACVFQQTTYLWVQTTLLFWTTCSFIRMRQASCRGFSRKNENKLARSFNFTFRYLDVTLVLQNFLVESEYVLLISKIRYVQSEPKACVSTLAILFFMIGPSLLICVSA